MALLQNTNSKKIIYLNAQHTFGRNQQNVNTFLSELDISQLHAIISWKDQTWYLYDQSRNGSLINNKFINNTAVKLNEGDLIQFGGDKTTEWKLIDNKQPCCYLKSELNPCDIIELSTSHVFPNEEKPSIFIYPSSDIWKIEQNGISSDLIHNQKYIVNDQEYTYIENRPIEDTMDMSFNINDAYFLFTLSPDEEHIGFKLIIKNQEIDLGERVHNYILLALARKRVDDFNANYTLKDQGWLSVDQLLSDLSKELNKEIDIYYLNLKVHRIRKLLLDIKLYGHLFSSIIERRSGQIRFSHPYFKIIKEDQSIGEVLPV